MRPAALLAAVMLVAACAATPSTGALSASTIAVDCDPYADAAADCLRIVAAAAEVAPIAIVPGTRAQVSTSAATRACGTGSSCITLAASAIFVHVVFTDPGGRQASADAVTNPLGQYTGVDPRDGP